MKTVEDQEVTGKSFLATSRNEKETNSNEDVNEADGAADCEANIQPGTVIEGDEHAAETLFLIGKSTFNLFLTLE